MTPPLKEDEDIFIITIGTKKPGSPSPLRIVAGSVQPWPKTMNLKEKETDNFLINATDKVVVLHLMQRQ